MVWQNADSKLTFVCVIPPHPFISFSPYRLLLMRGAALDHANSLGWTPLFLAARHGHANVVNLLIQNQADVNAETKLAANALTVAARGGHLQVRQLSGT